MATQTSPPPEFRPLDVLVFPLRLLERSRGWRRRLLIVAYLIVGAILGVLTWRAASLRTLPDVGDPFDVAAFLKSGQVPGDRDAFPLYRRAVGQLQRIDVAQDGSLWRALQGGWSTTSPKIRKLVEDNRDVLATWRLGTDKPDCAPGREEVARDDYNAFLALIDEVSKLGIVEGARLEAEGDLAGAWTWYHAALRSCHHLKVRSPFRWRGVANGVETMVKGRLMSLAMQPKADRALLRAILDEVLALDAAMPPTSDNYKAEYLVLVGSIADPAALLRGAGDQETRQYLEDPNTRPWYRFYLFLIREPERARRIARLYFANHLAQCDRPPSARPPWVGNAPTGPIWSVYQADPAAPEAARALAPEKLFDWIMASPVAQHTLPMDQFYAPIADVERRSRAPLILLLADQLYFRDHGAYPPTNDALVGPYLRRIPEGSDAVPAAEDRHQ